MNRIEATGLTKIPLGRQGENLARQNETINSCKYAK